MNSRGDADFTHSGVDHILHPTTSIVDIQKTGPRIVAQGNGVYVEDQHGNKQIDAIAGLWCVNVGYGRKELADVMASASEKLSYYHTFGSTSNIPQIALAEKLISITPKSLTKVFYGCSGSDANDTLVKIAWQYHQLRGKPNKVKIIAREQAYHGTSISAASLTGLPSFHRGFGLPLERILRVSCPHYWRFGKTDESEAEYCDRLIQEVADLIEKEGADNIAAFIAEPIMAAGGVIPPPKDYFSKLHPLLKQHDILLIADEVVCGYGRLGVQFGSELLGIEPDMMASAKGLTSGYFPLSAAFISENVWEVMTEGSRQYGSFAHGYTYSGHPVGCAVALANLDLIEKEKLVENANTTGEYLHQQLQQRFAHHPHVGEIRGHGLLAGIQLVEDKASKRLFDVPKKIPAQITKACMNAGIIVRPLPTIGTIALSPPLTFTKEHVDLVIDVIEQGLDQVLA
ncbi:putative aminotransferase [Thalassocella blandensis]|nr:putative aminotransferase [Thalassocella blandensis]